MHHELGDLRIDSLVHHPLRFIKVGKNPLAFWSKFRQKPVKMEISEGVGWRRRPRTEGVSA
jgi:hypothetical protein